LRAYSSGWRRELCAAPHRVPASRRLRQAREADIAGMQRVRHSVRENRLVSTTISDEQVRDAIENTGRGWVVECAGEVVGFAVGNAATGNIWALFVHPDHERRGYGRLLHDTMVEWLWSQGLERLWLTTEPGTRAQRFYEAAGWQHMGSTESGELRYEKREVQGTRRAAEDIEDALRKKHEPPQGS
jgi:GNAT superfamily N-acetyltransferase